MTSSASCPTPPATDLPLDTQLYTMIELEASRYRAFYAKLTTSLTNCSPPPPLLLSRHAAVTFFCKSSLSHDHVQELYTRIKELRLLRDMDHLNETEFVLGMHFIVCLTKRKLVEIPRPFPVYLFPTLDLTPEEQRPVAYTSLSFSRAGSASVSCSALSSWTDAKSLLALLTAAGRSKQEDIDVLSAMRQSIATAQQTLHTSVDRVSDQVDKLGFPVPPFLRSLDALDDLKSLLQQHVLAAKEEIQSMQTDDAQMRNVAVTMAHDSIGGEKNALDFASGLTQELVALQQQTAQLMAMKADLAGRLAAVKAGDLTAGGRLTEQSNGSASIESKNPSFALSKGALTVGELRSALASTVPAKSSELVSAHNRNAVSCEDWGTYGTAVLREARPAQAHGVKLVRPLTSNDPFDFASSPAAPSAADAVETKKSEWDPFQ
ncbi:unnamed protein product [Hyaloperonospora brassicae]|uniref:Uncharacterized protein n=1 Tax=Hyaloperonospora brassicae TaxID=162125 RepID=A0AAV0TAA9_HYABA|nr:unnamed protein product [Hyaloperonospora brassicae]